MYAIDSLVFITFFMVQYIVGFANRYLGKCHWLTDSVYAHLKERIVLISGIIVLIIHHFFLFIFFLFLFLFCFLLNGSITEINVLKILIYDYPNFSL